jgi:Ring finger domain
MSSSSLTSSNIRQREEDNNDPNGPLLGAILIAILIALVLVVGILLRFVVNLGIDVCILHDMSAARARCKAFYRFLRHPCRDTTLDPPSPPERNGSSTNVQFENSITQNENLNTVELMERDTKEKVKYSEEMVAQFMRDLFPSTILTEEHMMELTRANDNHMSSSIAKVQNNNPHIDTNEEIKTTTVSSSVVDVQQQNPQQLLHNDTDDVDDDMALLRPTCSICLIEFAIGQLIYTVPACHHSFHTSCIQQWILPTPSGALYIPPFALTLQMGTIPEDVDSGVTSIKNNNNHCPNCRTPVLTPDSNSEALRLSS